MLFLSILDKMNHVAENFTANPGPIMYCVEARAENFDRKDIPALAKSITRCLSDCYLKSFDDNSFVVEWECFIVNVSFNVGSDGVDVATIDMDLCDEVPFDF